MTVYQVWAVRMMTTNAVTVPRDITISSLALDVKVVNDSIYKSNLI